MFILLHVFLSALIIYGGSGVNAFFFCCNDCYLEGTSAITKLKCGEIHSHQHSYDSAAYLGEHMYNQSVALSHSGCSVHRINLDWESFSRDQFYSALSVTHLNYSLFITDMGGTLLSENRPPIPLKNRRTQKPPDLTKEVYFSLLTTLII